MLRCTEVSQPIDAVGHSRPGWADSKSGNVRFCPESDRQPSKRDPAL